LQVQALAVIQPEWLQAQLLSDGELAPHELDFRHADALRLGGPWGQSFPEPLFDGDFEVLQWRLLKDRHLRYTLAMAGRSAPLNAIHFDGWTGAEPPRRVRLAYRLVTDDYRGGEAVQLMVEHCEPSAALA
jgi:single-stranded-DNA-specific exonuclease